MLIKILCILSMTVISIEGAAVISKAPKKPTTIIKKTNDGNVDVEVTLSRGEIDHTALINKIMLTGKQIQIDAELVDSAKPLIDYMMKRSIEVISKVNSFSTGNNSSQQHHPNTKAMNKRLFTKVLQPLMKIYFREVPAEVQKIINSANTMVTRNVIQHEKNITKSVLNDDPDCDEIKTVCGSSICSYDVPEICATCIHCINNNPHFDSLCNSCS